MVPCSPAESEKRGSSLPAGGLLPGLFTSAAPAWSAPAAIRSRRPFRRWGHRQRTVGHLVAPEAAVRRPAARAASSGTRSQPSSRPTACGCIAGPSGFLRRRLARKCGQPIQLGHRLHLPAKSLRRAPAAVHARVSVCYHVSNPQADRTPTGAAFLSGGCWVVSPGRTSPSSELTVTPPGHRTGAGGGTNTYPGKNPEQCYLPSCLAAVFIIVNPLVNRTRSPAPINRK